MTSPAPPSPPTDSPAAAGPYRRLHAWLLPDYNRRATAYWWTVVALGTAALAYAVRRLADGSAELWMHLLAGTALAIVAGLFPVRIRQSKTSFTAGETVIFVLLLMHGAPAAAVVAAAEALAGSWRTTRRWSSRIASPALAAIAMLGAGSALHGALAVVQAVHAPGQAQNAGWVIAATLVMALAYFVAISVLLGILPRLKRREWLRGADLVGVFGWVGMAYAGSAVVASLVFLAYKVYGGGVIVGLVPVLAMLLAALHHQFGRQEAAVAADAVRAEAAAREAQLAVRHMRELEASERRYQHLAFHDSLTSLPNRRRLLELLKEAVAAARAPAANDFAVMFLDFDRFKLINDSLGHDAGDDFLVQVSHRIQASLRPGDVVARLGGDEFAVLVRQLAGEAAVVALAERLMEALARPFHVAGTELITSASIGITFSRFGYTTPEQVLRDADTAMYKAKGAGKARYALFDTHLHTEVARRLRLEGELRHAIETGQLALAYQPIQELASGRLAGFEALVRWQHPVDGTLAPGIFLPIAEEAGMMVRISEFVLQCACRQLRRWQDERPAQAPLLTMSVNVSGHDIAHPAFVARVSRALVESGLQARQLTLELTEHILMSRLECALAVLTELRQMGVGVAVDDFGTGYSSLSHLATLPIDTLKIDRSFVARLTEGSREAAVVRSIISLGNSLGKAVLAEGIETEPQRRQLEAMGCELGQGFLLAPPLSAEQARVVACGEAWRELPLHGAPYAPYAPDPGHTSTTIH
ncbi:MAG: bifunctional diguanylate cyclase/phosphodiesterase [Burkholderiales bacterium]|nr:bifunctional diguanylate cyclase/phosphodiesterase [Burkholderiales bacterium]